MRMYYILYTRDEWKVEQIASYYKVPVEQVIAVLRNYGIEIKEKKKHKYPKNRRKSIYKNTQKYYLLQSFPESYIEETWVKYGQYKGSDILNCSPKVLWHLAREKGWKRPLPDFLVQAVHMGTWKMSKNYFIEEDKNE